MPKSPPKESRSGEWKANFLVVPAALPLAGYRKPAGIWDCRCFPFIGLPGQRYGFGWLHHLPLSGSTGIPGGGSIGSADIGGELFFVVFISVIISSATKIKHPDSIVNQSIEFIGMTMSKNNLALHPNSGYFCSAKLAGSVFHPGILNMISRTFDQCFAALRAARAVPVRILDIAAIKKFEPLIDSDLQNFKIDSTLVAGISRS